MNAKTILAVLMLAGVGGAVYNFTADPSPLDQLLTVPKTAFDPGYRDIEIIIPETDLSLSAEPGRITVFVFTSDSCPSCEKLDRFLRMLTGRRGDVAVRLIDVGYRWSSQQVRMDYGINIATVPHVVIYGSDGKLIARDDGREKEALELLCEWVNTELRRSDADRYASRG
jgi:hypothetical protein